MCNRIGVALVTICLAFGSQGAAYDRIENGSARQPREFSGRIVDFGDTFVSVQQDTSRTTAIRHRFKINRDTIVTAALAVGRQVRVLYKVTRFSRKKSVRKALVIEIIPEPPPQDPARPQQDDSVEPAVAAPEETDEDY